MTRLVTRPVTRLTGRLLIRIETYRQALPKRRWCIATSKPCSDLRPVVMVVPALGGRFGPDPAAGHRAGSEAFNGV